MPCVRGVVVVVVVVAVVEVVVVGGEVTRLGVALAIRAPIHSASPSSIDWNNNKCHCNNRQTVSRIIIASLNIIFSVEFQVMPTRS